MNKDIYNVLLNEWLTESVVRLVVEGDTSAIKRPGQFVNIAVQGFYLRRPISVCNYDGSTITLVYKVVGEGTEALARYGKGDKLDILVGLGNGFDTAADCTKPIVIGGGVGVPPLYGLTKKLLEVGKKPSVVMCFNTKNELFLFDDFRKLGVEVAVATVDGSCGVKGYYSDAIDDCGIEYDYYYTCGPLAMLRNIHRTLEVDGQISLEERMGCGFGGCMGCSYKTRDGYRRVCTDTVVSARDILFD